MLLVIMTNFNDYKSAHSSAHIEEELTSPEQRMQVQLEQAKKKPFRQIGVSLIYIEQIQLQKLKWNESKPKKGKAMAAAQPNFIKGNQPLQFK